MSLTYTNIIKKIEQSCGFEVGEIQNNATRLASFTIDVNLAQDEVMAEALKNSGWNVDDFNHAHDPFITVPLVSGQRDYHFSTDEDSALILDIYKVMVKDSNGIYQEIRAIDQQSDATSSFWDGNNTTGMPTCYDKTGNGIFLDPIPATGYVTLTAGLKVFIDREAQAFVVGDTTKISGIDGLCHDYLYLKPSYEFARDKGLQNREALFRDLQVSMKRIKDRYGYRAKDERKVITMGEIIFM